MSKIIRNINPDCKISGNLTSPRTGAFEIEVNGKLVYSKFNTLEFPTKKELDEIFKQLI